MKIHIHRNSSRKTDNQTLSTNCQLSNDITFTFSTKTFNIGKDSKSAFSPTSGFSSLPERFERLATLLEKNQDSYLIALNVFFPATDTEIFDIALKPIVIRYSLFSCLF